MRIEQDVKLDFKDVLFRPKRSTLSSRKEVDLSRKYQFRWSGKTWAGFPIMAANMDGVGTFEMAKALQKYPLFTCLIKSYALADWDNNIADFHSDDVAISTGTSERDYDKLVEILTKYPQIQFICIDVANGYSEKFGDFVGRVRTTYSDKTIIAGNVVTADMTQELILRGADIVKVGIGPGCFLPGTIVNTVDGSKPIEEVKVGDIVKTHTGAEKPVIDTLVYNNTKSIISINGIKSTDSHEYYVLHKKYKDIVTDENVHELAEWLEAKELTKDYLLLRHK